MASGSKLVIYAALAGNLAIAVTKFAAAAIAGSSSMLTEGIHSLVDTANERLLLYGRKRAQRPPDDLHPLGHGREIYFWSFVVALLIFTAGAGMSVYEGIVHIRAPEAIVKPWINFAVLGAAFVFESISLYFGVREFNRGRQGDETYWRALLDSKDPQIFVVMMEDAAALAGLLVAATFIGIAVVTGNPIYDGIGSIVIGVILGAVAVLLSIECKKLLIGERADSKVVEGLCRIAHRGEGVRAVNDVIAIHLAPEQVIATLSIEFADDRSIVETENAIAAIEAAIKEQFPEIQRLFVRPQSHSQARAERARLRSSEG